MFHKIDEISIKTKYSNKIIIFFYKKILYLALSCKINSEPTKVSILTINCALTQMQIYEILYFLLGKSWWAHPSGITLIKDSSV